MGKILHIDLFAGIGGFSYAIDQVYGKENTKHIFVEIDPFCQAVLKKHWPEGEYWGDIREFIAYVECLRLECPRNGRGVSEKSQKVGKEGHQTTQAIKDNDISSIEQIILTGGFPCQPFSQAGKRRGTQDNRYLWPEMFRAIQLTKPQWVIAENVYGILTIEGGLVFKQVCSDLETEGYEVQSLIIPAVAVNAPHRRDRVWIIAYKPSKGLEGGGKNKRCSENSINASDATGERFRRGGEDESEQQPSMFGQDIQQNAPNTESRQSGEQTKQERREDFGRRNWEENWVEVATRLCGMDDGLSRGLHSLIISIYDDTKIDNKKWNKKSIIENNYACWKILRELWKQRKFTMPSSFLYQFGLCDTLPELSSEERSKRWLTEEKIAKTMRGLWKRFYSLSFKEAQNLQSRLLEKIGEIQRNEALVFKKEDKKVSELWARVYLPSGKVGELFKKLREYYGLEKKDVEIISPARHRKERLKMLGNAIVPQVVIEIFKAIKHNGLSNHS